MIVHTKYALREKECNDYLDSVLLICVRMIMVHMLKDSLVAAA